MNHQSDLSVGSRCLSACVCFLGPWNYLWSSHHRMTGTRSDIPADRLNLGASIKYVHTILGLFDPLPPPWQLIDITKPPLLHTSMTTTPLLHPAPKRTYLLDAPLLSLHRSQFRPNGRKAVGAIRSPSRQTKTDYPWNRYKFKRRPLGWIIGEQRKCRGAVFATVLF